MDRVVIESLGAGFLRQDNVFFSDDGQIYEVTDEPIFEYKDLPRPIVQGAAQLSKNASSAFEARVRAGDIVSLVAPESSLRGRILTYPKDASELKRALYLRVLWDGMQEPEWVLKSQLVLSY